MTNMHITCLKSQQMSSVLSILMEAQKAPPTQTAAETTNLFTTIKGSCITTDSYLLQFDGLSEPNPGESSGGAVLYAPDGSVVFEAGEFIPHATNNQAEYSGLILGLTRAAACVPPITNLRIEGDSMLIINQVAGKWKIKNDVLKALHAAVLEILGGSAFTHVGIRHVYRDQNKHADRLTNDVMKTRESFYKTYK